MSSPIVRKFLNGGFDEGAPQQTNRQLTSSQTSSQTSQPKYQKSLNTRPLKLPDPKELVRNVKIPEAEVERRPFKIPISGKGITTEELEISWFAKEVNIIKDRSVIFYGPSGSGKTALIYDMMFKARYVFPKVFIFAPTNREKRDYENIVPKEMIYEEFGLDDIKNIYEHQRASAHAYNTANNLETLGKLFEKIASPPQRTHVATLCRQKRMAEIEIEKIYTNPNDRKSKHEELDAMHKNRLIVFYKQNVIKPNVQLLHQMNLSTDESMAVKYLNFNPRVLIVFDDAMTEIMTLVKIGRKTNDNVIKDFFFKGRWAYITHFYAFQDDNRLETEIKKNAFVSVFTSPNVATAFFGRLSASFAKQEKARADAAIKLVFANENDQVDNYRKLVYCRLNTKNPFQYTIADLHEDFHMCSRSIRNYCKSVAQTDEVVDKNNPHLRRFSEF